MAANANGGSSAQPQHNASDPYSHRLEPSFLNTEPQDEFIKEIADWIAFTSGGKWTFMRKHA